MKSVSEKNLQLSLAHVKTETPYSRKQPIEFNVPKTTVGREKEDNGPAAVRVRTTSGRPPRQRENKNNELSDTISNTGDMKSPELKTSKFKTNKNRKSGRDSVPKQQIVSRSLSVKDRF